jgi:hypothetical protein
MGMGEKRDFLEELVYSALETDGGFRRFTQDSPIMPDVWIHYGLEPYRRHDLILTPVNDRSPGKLAKQLQERLKEDRNSEYNNAFLSALRKHDLDPGRPRIAYNETTVAVELWFHELVRVLLPLTTWWRNQLRGVSEGSIHPLVSLNDKNQIEQVRSKLKERLDSSNSSPDDALVTQGLVWLTRVAGTIGRAADLASYSEPISVTQMREWPSDSTSLMKTTIPLIQSSVVLDEEEELGASGPLFSINRNRESVTAMYLSVPTIKADAARKVFDVKGNDITWAVIDSGIDAKSFAFRKRDHNGIIIDNEFATRVVKTYDFTRIRDQLSIVDDDDRDLPEGFAEALQTGRMIDWEELETVLKVEHAPDKYTDPKSPHGTHVAGILAADWRSEDCKADALPERNPREHKPDHRTGVCPEMQLYDLRVIGDDGRGSEFSIMAALQFVRSLNARRDYVEIHGVNLSISIEHEVSYYACGRTPVCCECERLVGAGTVVVAAAGNNGRVRFLTRGGDKEAYSSISITDPGNADAVITVGATHRREPHTYGVSYFSSRGPTGDGRMKPDLVAPGEKICSTIPGNREEYMDGTSMAAPHVSGAAAMLMSRYPELIGTPYRIKKILCETATDLGREKYFQGAGLLDILRALQSI